MKLSNMYNGNNTTEFLTNQESGLINNQGRTQTGDKETIKVFVITGKEEEAGDVTYKKMINGNTEYSGIGWDILEEVKKEPEMKKYNFEYTPSTNYRN